MTVLPGSLNYLYYDGILDHIPTEAYGAAPITQSAISSYNGGTAPYNPYVGMKQAALGNTPLSANSMNNVQSNPLNGNSFDTGYLGQTNYGAYNASGSGLGTQYLDSAKSGALYNLSGMNDAYTPTNGRPPYYGRTGSNYNYKDNAFSLNSGYGKQADYSAMALGDEGANIKDSVAQALQDTRQSVINKPGLGKGLLALALIIATPILCFKSGKKVPVQATSSNTGLLSKIKALFPRKRK
ncbi:MAG: hypothetical protein MJ237_07395 [bacterium]|nr:hypothetical protein [bacterium]